MIVKIWPIKGAQGIKRVVNYVDDEQKILVQYSEQESSNATEWIEMDGISRTVEYMSDQHKTKSKLISGYFCDPQRVEKEFRETRTYAFELSRGKKKPKNLERENLAFHMVQSFPEDLDISDEEVHECGIELLQKLENFQGIVCSHVHPVTDEEGEVHGKCKHNHILLNAYMMPNGIDPEHPNRVKYHDCKETYAQLQIWNDEIAIEHGLPIIRNPDLDRVYSWKENHETKNVSSWKERIRLDIEAARRVTSSWDGFKTRMERFGYQLRDGVHLTYIAPDGEHRVRGGTLGSPYTKESLELYWIIRDRIEVAVETSVKENEAPPLWAVAQKHGPLSVGVPLGAWVNGSSPTYSLPLEKGERTREVLSSYFHDQELYDVLDVAGRPVAVATGRELVNYLDNLRRGEDERWTQKRQQKEHQERQERWQQEEEDRRRREKRRKKNAYTSNFKNSRTKQNYYAPYRDENGRRRSTLELLFLLAIVVLKSEDGLWDYKGKVSDDMMNEAVFGPTDWKIQNMMDALHFAAEEGLESPAQIDQRLNETGAAYSRAESALQKTKRYRDKMEALDRALNEYDATKDIAERIQALPEGPGKAKMQERYKDEIERYKTAKNVMCGYGVTTQDQIEDFRIRYADIVKNLPVMQEQFDKTKERYKQLKKLQYNVRLAQTEQYCYGPAYGQKVDWEELEQHIYAAKNEQRRTLDQQISDTERQQGGKERHGGVGLQRTEVEKSIDIDI